jgi:hypothetical protein
MSSYSVSQATHCHLQQLTMESWVRGCRIQDLSACVMLQEHIEWESPRRKTVSSRYIVVAVRRMVVQGVVLASQVVLMFAWVLEVVEALPWEVLPWDVLLWEVIQEQAALLAAALEEWVKQKILLQRPPRALYRIHLILAEQEQAFYGENENAFCTGNTSRTGLLEQAVVVREARQLNQKIKRPE